MDFLQRVLKKLSCPKISLAIKACGKISMWELVKDLKGEYLLFCTYLIFILMFYIAILPFADLVGDDPFWGSLAVSIARSEQRPLWGSGWFAIKHSAFVSYLEAVPFFFFGTVRSIYYIPITALIILHIALILIGKRCGSILVGYLASAFLILCPMNSFFLGLGLWNPILTPPFIALALLGVLNFICLERSELWILFAALSMCGAIHAHLLSVCLAQFIFFLGGLFRGKAVSKFVSTSTAILFFILTSQFFISAWIQGEWIYLALLGLSVLLLVAPIYKLTRYISSRLIFRVSGITIVSIILYSFFIQRLQVVSGNTRFFSPVSRYMLFRHNYHTSNALLLNIQDYLSLYYLQLIWIVPLVFQRCVTREKALLAALNAVFGLLILYMSSKMDIPPHYIAIGMSVTLICGALIIEKIKFSIKGICVCGLVSVWLVTGIIFSYNLINQLSLSGGDGPHCANLETKEKFMEFIKNKYPLSKLLYYARNESNKHDLEAWRFVKNISLPPDHTTNNLPQACLAIFEPFCSLESLSNLPAPQGRSVLSIGVNSLIEVPCSIENLYPL